MSQTDSKKNVISDTTENVDERKGNTIRVRRACFTLNNYNDDECVSLSQWISNKKFFVYGFEYGIENNTPHIQGYVEFDNQMRWSTLLKVNPRIHWEKAKASRDFNIVYCCKENDFRTNGDFNLDELRSKVTLIKENHTKAKKKYFDCKQYIRDYEIEAVKRDLFIFGFSTYKFDSLKRATEESFNINFKDDNDFWDHLINKWKKLNCHSEYF